MQKIYQILLRYRILLIPLAALVFFAPAFILGSGGSDLVFHILWSREFAKEFWGGTLYPRWLPDLYAGCGSPVFYFYSPLPYYFTSLFAFTDKIEPQSWYPIALAGFTGLLLTGFFCYIWLKSFIDRGSALLGAVAYMNMPYVYVDFYSRLTFSEFFTFTWAPLLLYCAGRIAEGKVRAVFLFSICLTLLILSNISGSIIMVFPVTAWFFFCTPREFLLKRTALYAVAGLLGTLLAAVYLLPILEGLPNIHLNKDNYMWNGQFDYARNFIFYPPVNPGKVYVSLFALIGFVAAFVLWKEARKSEFAISKKQANFWFGASLACVFMMLPISKPVWMVFSFLQIMQFPWRILIALAVTITALIAITLSTKKEPKEREKALWNYWVIMPILCMMVGISWSPSSRWVLNGERSSDLPPRFQEVHEIFYNLNMVPFQEYVPMGVDLDWFSGPKKVNALAEKCRERTHFISGRGKVESIDWQSKNIRFRVKIFRNSVIRVGQFYYPNWYINDGYKITPEAKTGMITIALPPGTHDVRLNFMPSRAERYGGFISLVAFLVVTIGYFICLVRRKL